MANSNGWGDGAANNTIGWGQGADNEIGWGSVYSVSSAGLTDIIGVAPVDPDAQAFITAAAITNPTQQAAINTLVVGLKADGTWTKSSVLYPIVGGVSTAHAVNLKSPGTYNMSFSSGWTHSANGMIGSSAFVNTQFNPATAGVNKSNFGMSVYSRSNTSGYKVDIGAVDSVSGSYSWLVPRYSGSLDFAGSYDDSNFNGNYLTNTLGLMSVVRDSATTQKLYQGGVQKGTRTGFNATADINLNIYFGARNNSTIAMNYSDRQYAFVAIHEGFNATEMNNFNTRIQAFQTALSRQV